MLRRSTTRAPRATASSSSSTASSPTDAALRRRRRAQRRGHGPRQRHAGRLRHRGRARHDDRGPAHARDRGRRDFDAAPTPASTTSCWSSSRWRRGRRRSSSSSSALDADSRRRRSSLVDPDRPARPTRVDAGRDRHDHLHSTPTGTTRSASASRPATTPARGPADRRDHVPSRDAATTDAATTSSRTCAPAPACTDVEVIDDETPGVRPIESGGTHARRRCGGADRRRTTLRLTQRPDAPTSRSSLLTDGLVDVTSINGVAGHAAARDDRRLRPVAALPRQPVDRRRRDAHARQRQRPRQLHRGGLRRRPVHPRRRSAAVAGYDALRSRPCTAHDDDAHPGDAGAAGDATPDAHDQPPHAPRPVRGRRRRSSTRAPARAPVCAGTSCPSWLADGFLEGQRVRVCTTADADLRRLQDRDHPRRQHDQGREARVHAPRAPSRVTRRRRRRHGVARHRRASPPSRRPTGTTQQTRRARRRRALLGAAHARGREGLPGLDAPAVASCAARSPSRAA